jgi:hypothetical protein
MASRIKKMHVPAYPAVVVGVHPAPKRLVVSELRKVMIGGSEEELPPPPP